MSADPGKRPLRVLHVIASMAPEAGGPPVICAGLTGALADRGHVVGIATVAAQDASGQRKTGAHVAIPPTVTLHAFPADGSPRYARSAALNLWLAEKTKTFDIVHLHSIWQFPTFVAARACWKSHVPYVSLLHGMLDRYSVRQRSPWIKRAYWLYRERKIQTKAAVIQCGNQAEIRRAVPWIQRFPKIVIGNGISGSEFDAMPPRGRFRAAHPEIASRPMALFLSRIHPKKGLDRLIPAWRSLAQRMPELVLVIAGAGEPDHVAAVDRLITGHHLGKQVIRVGQLIGQNKWEALVDADVFVLPSHQEGFSMAITEALAAGCPAVVTEECNFDELENEHSGIIIRNGDMAAFVQSVEKLLQDPAQRAAAGACGSALIRAQYTWEKLAAKMERVYRQMLAGKTFSPDGTDVC